MNNKEHELRELTKNSDEQQFMINYMVIIC
jgi:hypothetical protein